MGQVRIQLMNDIESEDFIMISKNILYYMEDFINQNILIKNNIVLHSRWNYQMFIGFNSDVDEKNMSEPYNMNYPAENTKNYYFSYPEEYLNKYDTDALIIFIKEVYNGVVGVLCRSFKKLKKEEVFSLIEKYDWNHLLSIPYPAPEDEVEYMGMPLKEYKAMFLTNEEYEDLQNNMYEQRVPQTPHLVTFPYFESIDINNLEEFYSITTKFNGRKIEIDLHCYKQTMALDTMNHIIKLLSNLTSLDAENRREIWASVQSKEESYYYLKELLPLIKKQQGKNKNSITEDLITELHFMRIAFFPDVPQSEIVCDYVLGSNLSDEQIVVFRKLNGLFDKIEVES